MNESECKMVVDYIEIIKTTEPDLAFGTILLLDKIITTVKRNIMKQVNNNAL